MIHSFEPIIAADSKILILGSMPSVRSLQVQEYYAHPRNRFWHILSAVYKTPLACYQDKLALLFAHQIALWDMVASCTREGSLDSAMQSISCHSITDFLDEHPHIVHVLCNGNKAGALYQKQYQGSVSMTVLPSTSPANAGYQIPVLLEIWRKAIIDARNDK